MNISQLPGMLVVAGVGLTSPAFAQAPLARDAVSGKERAVHDVRLAVPNLGYAYTAYGADVGRVGAQGYGQALVAPDQNAVLGGGATVWGSPLERLTLIGDAQRNPWGNFSPSAAAVVRLLGDSRDGWSLGALGKFKVDGFASGPHKDEIESELELGALVSFSDVGWHLDLNAIAGRGLGDEGEADTELRLRFGRDLGRYVRLGIDGQGRVRVAGPRYLPNGRIWDFAAGPQLLVGSGALYAALTGGPATVGLLSTSVGFSSQLCVGGTI